MDRHLINQKIVNIAYGSKYNLSKSAAQEVWDKSVLYLTQFDYVNNPEEELQTINTLPDFIKQDSSILFNAESSSLLTEKKSEINELYKKAQELVHKYRFEYNGQIYPKIKALVLLYFVLHPEKTAL